MSAIVTLARKDLKLIFRDKFALFWILAFPLMYSLFFGMIFGGSGGDDSRGSLSIALVDDDRSEESRALIDRLASHESVRVERGEAESEAPPGLHELEDARAAVRKGQKVAYVRIPAGYGASPFALFGGGDDPPRIEVGIDPSRAAEAGFLQGVLMETLFGGMGERFMDRDKVQQDLARARTEIAAADDLSAPQKLVLGQLVGAVSRFMEEVDDELLEEGSEGDGVFGGADPYEVVEVARDRGNNPRSAFEVTFPQAVVWGLMSVAMGFAVTIVRERTQGTLIRLRIAPIGLADLLAGKALACFVTCLLVMAFLLAVGVVALGVRVDSPLLMALSMIFTAFCFTGLMMTASVLGKSEQAVAGASWGLMMPFAMIGGGMIPLIAMPPWLVKLSNLSPFKWSIYSIEGAVWRGFAPADMVVPCAVMAGIGVVFFGVGVLVFRRVG